MSMLVLLVLAMDILGFTAWACVSDWGKAGLNNQGPHGMSEMLYAYSSAAGNNGSAFAGLTANTYWYNTTLALGMLIGRFLMIVPIMVIAGSLAAKKTRSSGAGIVSGFRRDLYFSSSRHGVARGRAQLSAGFGPGTRGRTLSHVVREDVLTADSKTKLSMSTKAHSLFDIAIVVPALLDSVVKLDPRVLIKNPVMFVTMIGAAVTTAEIFISKEPHAFTVQISVWLWFTVLFANFAEAMAEGRGKAQANALRLSRSKSVAKVIRPDGQGYIVEASELRRGDVIQVVAGEIIAADGDVILGAATVDESAITGESAPVIREAGGDRSSVTGGTRVLSDELKIVVSADPGHSFLDRMIGLVEGAKRQKTPNEIALTILLSALTVIFLVVCVDPAAFRNLFQGHFFHDGFGCPAGLSHSHHHRRSAQRHRHRGHRSPGAKERPGHERPRGGGSR